MVLICHNHSFIFLKTRKTAGTSIEMHLEPLCAPANHVVTEATHAKVCDLGIVGRRRIPPDQYTADDMLWYNHMPARQVAKQLGQDVFARYTKVISVRNPFDRMLSAFTWIGSEAAATADFATIKRRFRRFVLNRKDGLDQKIVTLNERHVADIAIRYEHLATDLEATKTKLGITAPLPPLLETKVTAAKRGGRAVAEFYDPQTIEAVRTKMAWVFEQYDYSDMPSDQAPEAA